MKKIFRCLRWPLFWGVEASDVFEHMIGVLGSRIRRTPTHGGGAQQCFVDIGANDGNELKTFQRLLRDCQHCTVFSVEANTRYHDLLHTISLASEHVGPRVHILKGAIIPEKDRGKKKYFLVGDDETGRLVEGPLSESIKKAKRVQPVQEIILKDALRAGNCSQVKVLKVDAEGFDAVLLLGMLNDVIVPFEAALIVHELSVRTPNTSVWSELVDVFDKVGYDYYIAGHFILPSSPKESQMALLRVTNGALISFLKDAIRSETGVALRRAGGLDALQSYLQPLPKTKIWEDFQAYVPHCSRVQDCWEVYLIHGSIERRWKLRK